MTALEDSPSETVRRHADTFRRWNPVVRERDPEPYVLPTVEPIATPTTDVGNNRTKRRQLVDLAGAHGWTWRAHATERSIVIRFRRPTGFGWECDRAVAYWSGAKLPFVAAFAWYQSGPVTRVPRGWDPWAHTITPVPVSAAALAEHLASPRAR